MTIGGWLDTRTPPPPPVLRARLDGILGAVAHLGVAEAPERLLAAGRAVAADLLHGGSTTRETALDLLAADALVTYAFEAASDDPSSLTQHAAAAMVSIASLGTAPSVGP